MSGQANICQIRGKASRSLLHWKKNLATDFCGPGGDWQKFKRLPDHIMYGQKYEQKLVRPAAQNREKQEWNNEKPKLDNARRLRGIYFINPDDQDYKETLKNAWRNLERPMAAAMPCKTKAQTSTTKVAAKQEVASQEILQTMYGCKMESHESTWQRMEASPFTKHEDRIAGKRFTSVSQYNLAHKFIPMPQAMKIPDAKAAMDKEWKKLETIPSWQLKESEGGYSGSTKRQKRKSTLLHWWTCVTSRTRS